MARHPMMSKFLSILVTITLIIGVASVSMVANATDYTEQEAKDKLADYGGFAYGDTVIVDGIKYEVLEGNWWVKTLPPGDAWKAIEEVHSIIVTDVNGNEVDSTTNVSIEEGSVYFACDDATSWSIKSNTVGATLNDNYNGGALINFTSMGTVTLVVTTSTGSREIVVEVDNSTVQLDVSNASGMLASGSKLTLEKAQAMDLYVDCTAPEDLIVTNTDDSVVSVTQGSTGVPLTLYAQSVGTSTVSVELYGKTMSFPVTVEEASNANFTVSGSPVVGLTTVAENDVIIVECSLDVDSWAVTSGDTSAITVYKASSNAVSVTGQALAGLATVTAYNAAGEAIGSFDVYVTKTATGYYTNILKYPSLEEAGTITLDVNDTATFLADCTIVYNSTNVVWEVANNSSNVVALSTTTMDDNNNPLAKITAKSAGTVVLKATANGVSDTITIKVNGTQVTPPAQGYVMKLESTRAYNNGVGEDTNESIIQGNVYKAKLQLHQGKTFLPARSVAEAIGLTVGYDAATSYSTITNGTKTVKIVPSSPNFIVVENGVETTVNAGNAPIYVKGVTHIPVRAVIEQFGFSVNWDANGYLLITDYAPTASQVATLLADAKAIIG